MPGWAKALIAAGILAVLIVNGIAWRAPEVGTFHDDGVYLVTAKALAEGKGYRIESLPNEIPQTKYPILFPLVLAGAWKLWPQFPQNVWLLKLVPLACSLAWFWLTWLLLRKDGASAPVAWAVVLTAAAAPWAVYFSTALLSETLFAALVTGCLLLLHRPPEDRRALYLSALLAGCAFLTRSIGLALLAAGPVWLAWQRRWADALRFAMIGGLLAAPWWVWTATRPPSESPVDAYYSKENYQSWNIIANFSPPQKAAILGRNLLMSVFTPGMLCGFPVKSWGILPAFMLSALILRGLWRRPRSALHVFLLFYFGLMLLWAWYPVRFFAPLLPLLLWLAWKGTAEWPIKARMTSASILLLLLAVATVQNSRATLLRGGAYPEVSPADRWSAQEDLFTWIRTNTAQDSVLAANLDPLFYLETGRKAVRGFTAEPYALLYAGGITAEPLGSVETFRTALLRQGVDYVVLTPGTTFFEAPPLAALAHALASEGALHPLETGSAEGYEVYRVDRTTLANPPSSGRKGTFGLAVP